MAALEGAGERPRELTGEVVTIGRDAVNDVVLDADPEVSRVHAELRHRDGQWLAVDLGSRNGTTVNGRPVGRHPLRDGDRLRLGATTLTFVAGVDTHATEVSPGAPAHGPALSDRERQVLALVADGRTDRDIADELVISVSTVRSHLDRVREKTGLRRRSELTRMAVEEGITG
jgi:pSer/pThr/pTyr-binding forkhead associated (FHA) protein